MKLRKAVMGEEKTLSELAFRSKAYWGYDDTFMEKAREDLTVSQKSISSNHVYVLENASKIVGFFYLNTSIEDSELEAFFVDHEFIGKGYGRLLWECLIEKVKEIGKTEFKLIADPYAEEFYKKMGAIPVGKFHSTIFKNRQLSILKVNI